MSTLHGINKIVNNGDIDFADRSRHPYVKLLSILKLPINLSYLQMTILNRLNIKLPKKKLIAFISNLTPQLIDILYSSNALPPNSTRTNLENVKILNEYIID